MDYPIYRHPAAFGALCLGHDGVRHQRDTGVLNRYISRCHAFRLDTQEPFDTDSVEGRTLTWGIPMCGSTWANARPSLVLVLLVPDGHD
jgi:hypothetical protein